jgi:hypothetical protein
MEQGGLTFAWRASEIAKPPGLGACLGSAALAQTWRTRGCLLYLVALLPFLPSLDLLS